MNTIHKSKGASLVHTPRTSGKDTSAPCTTIPREPHTMYNPHPQIQYPTTTAQSQKVRENKAANTTKGPHGRTRSHPTLHLDPEEGPLSRCLAAGTHTWPFVRALFWWPLTLCLLRESKKRANTAKGLYGRVYSFLALLRGGPTHQAAFVVGPLSRCHAAILLQGL